MELAAEGKGPAVRPGVAAALLRHLLEHEHASIALGEARVGLSRQNRVLLRTSSDTM